MEPCLATATTPVPIRSSAIPLVASASARRTSLDDSVIRAEPDSTDFPSVNHAIARRRLCARKTLVNVFARQE